MGLSVNGMGYRIGTTSGVRSYKVGVLKNGDGPTALLRADMDALPVREQTGLPYASTVNGHITTDFPLMIRGKFSGRQISGAIGQGGPELSLKTVNGSIELRRARI